MGIFDTRVKGRGWKQQPLTPAQKQAQDVLSRVGTTNLPAPTRQVAPATATEQYGYGVLDKYVRSSPPGTLTEAITQAMDIAKTPIDIMKIPGMSSVLDLAMKAGDRYLGSVKRTLKGTGNLRSSPGAGVLGRAAGEVTGNIAATMAPYAESAIERKFRNIPLLGQLGEAQEKGVWDRLEAIQRFDLERQLVQAGFDAAHAKQLADIQIKMQQEEMRLRAMASILGGPGYIFDKGIMSPSIFSNVVRGVEAGVSLFGGGGGGGSGAWAGGNTTPGFGTPTAQGTYYA